MSGAVNNLILQPTVAAAPLANAKHQTQCQPANSPR